MPIMPTAIIFDWDNTLVNAQTSLDYALKNTMYDLGYKIDDGIVNTRALYTSRRQYLQKEFQDKWQEANTLYDKYLHQIPVGQVTLNQNVYVMLECILQKNIPMVVVSNKIGDSLRTEIKQFNLSKFFNCIIGSGDTSEDKPSVIPALTALQEIAIKPSKKVWFIGDSLTDMECARKIGATKVLYGENIADDIISDLYIKNYQEIITLLQK